MGVRLLRPLDRYVLGEFLKTFAVTVIGFPVLLSILDLAEKIDNYLARDVPRQDIALSYLYFIPESMFLVFPAAVLFATVFSVGTFTRHSEITAAKASGISFYRFVRPIFLGAVVAAALNLVVGELAPPASERRRELLRETTARADSTRHNFAFAAEYGRVYKAGMLDRVKGRIDNIQIERKGQGLDYPTYVVVAKEARFLPTRSGEAGWLLQNGQLHIMADSAGRNQPIQTMSFGAMIDNRFRERPLDLTARPRDPEEMRFEELGRFITALERSGGNANKERVSRVLKIAIPVTCLIIALFGAPLATSSQRGGAAYGIGLSLVTTVVFLLLIQLTRSIGGTGLMPPDLAAWVPNALFLVLGVVLLARVRT
ncbi:MAG TPA: LptF/LptG family permease [Gemmatimonadaceae bacterium]|nr:LptF/LptG family permease [Gemmatimonadaceae bacterium]